MWIQEDIRRLQRSPKQTRATQLSSPSEDTTTENTRETKLELDDKDNAPARKEERLSLTEDEKIVIENIWHRHKRPERTKNREAWVTNTEGVKTDTTR